MKSDLIFNGDRGQHGEVQKTVLDRALAQPKFTTTIMDYYKGREKEILFIFYYNGYQT